MGYQTIFRQNYVEELVRTLKNGTSLPMYENESFEYNVEKTLQSPLIIQPENVDFLIPDKNSFYDFENAKIIFEAYRSLTPLQASDIRFWTYLAHADYYKYMKKRWPKLENKDQGGRTKYILDHWFIPSLTQSNFLLHGIAGLWWGAYLTYDASRTDAYELTRVLFTQLDFATRTLGAYSLARHKEAVLGILDYILLNPNLFETRFQQKSRFLTKYLNQIGGTKPLTYFDRTFFKEKLESVENKIALI
jgi:hypothetical protein